MSRRTRQERPPTSEEIAKRIEQLRHSDPEARWDAARWLGANGDGRALPALEEVALFDDDTFSVEGGFVDRTEAAWTEALSALRLLYARLPLSEEDMSRLERIALQSGALGERPEYLLAALGEKGRAIVVVALAHESADVRLRAHNVLGRLDRAPANHALAVDDEEVRLAATRQDCYRSMLVRAALERLPAEPSARVRRGIAELWLRYRRRMGGTLRLREVMVFLEDSDEEVRATVAAHLVHALEGEGRSPRIDDSWQLARRIPALIEGESNDRVKELLQRARDELQRTE